MPSHHFDTGSTSLDNEASLLCFFGRSQKEQPFLSSIDRGMTVTAPYSHVFNDKKEVNMDFFDGTGSFLSQGPEFWLYRLK